MRSTWRRGASVAAWLARHGEGAPFTTHGSNRRGVPRRGGGRARRSTSGHGRRGIESNVLRSSWILRTQASRGDRDGKTIKITRRVLRGGGGATRRVAVFCCGSWCFTLLLLCCRGCGRCGRCGRCGHCGCCGCCGYGCYDYPPSRSMAAAGRNNNNNNNNKSSRPSETTDPDDRRASRRRALVRWFSSASPLPGPHATQGRRTRSAAAARPASRRTARPCCRGRPSSPRQPRRGAIDRSIDQWSAVSSISARRWCRHVGTPSRHTHD